MPRSDVSSDEVRTELTDILVHVVGCAPEDVVDHAKLKELGVDSLAVVEMADELGLRFDVYLSDETVNGLRTVADAVRAVVRHEGANVPRSTTFAPTPPTVAAAEAPSGVAADPAEQRSALRRLAFWFAVAGAGAGIGLGLGGAALIGATGISSTSLPPIAVPSTPAPTTATPTPTPTPIPTEEETVDPDPTLIIENTQVSPGERFTLEGSFPELEEGETLQVQVKDPGEAWDEFPVTTQTRGGGDFRTQIYTSRTGEREFRMAAEDAELTTPAVTVQIG